MMMSAGPMRGLCVATFRWMVTAAYTAVITTISLTPNRSLRRFMVSWEFPNRDKCLHFLMYGVLAVLLTWALQLHAVKSRTRLLVAISCAAYGLAVEILQVLVLPGDRMFSAWDAVANLAGAACAIVALGAIRRD
ncbi:MAG: VanZ family protein [Candidatus Eisenbacteria bacterium]|jgi:hypothetical protein|nr:VanZ family protein [Candidatus Eisenbacteria bacterium]